MSAPLSCTRCPNAASAFVGHIHELDRGKAGRTLPQTRVGKQILDQLAHSVRTLGYEPHVFGRLVIQAVGKLLLDELRVALDDPEWFLKVVGGDMGESVQILVAAHEFFVDPFEGLFAFDPLCDDLGEHDNSADGAIGVPPGVDS